MTEDELAQKLQIFKNRKGTTGWAVSAMTWTQD
jgi:hypothetical protein